MQCFAKQLLVVALLATMLAATVAQVQVKSGQAQVHGGTAVIAIASDPRRLDPTASDFISQEIWVQIYEGLAYYDENFVAHPQLAQSWEITPDHKQITFHLVQNATWTDGVPFTSADVRFSVEQIAMKLDFGVIEFFNPILDKIETPDDHTIIFKYTAPPVDDLWVFTANPLDMLIYPEHIWKSNPDPFNNTQASNNPIGTGPYKLLEWVRGDHVTLVRNENYWAKDVPYLDKLVFQVIPDPAARILALQSKTVNLIFTGGVPLAQFSRVISIPGIAGGLIAPPSDPSYAVIFINADPILQPNKILLDKNVRHAMAYAIDKTAYVTKVWYGLTQPAYGPSTSPAYHHKESPVARAQFATQNVTLANKILDDAGYKRGADGSRFSMQLDVIASRDWAVSASEIFSEQMRSIGIDVKLNDLDTATAFDRFLTSQNFQAHVGYLSGAGPAGIGGASGISAWYSKLIIPGGFEINQCRYNSTDYDKVYEQMLAEVDPAKHDELDKKLQEMAVDSATELFLTTTVQPYVLQGIAGYPSDDIGMTLRYTWSFAAITSTGATTAATTTSVSAPPDMTPWIVAAAAIIIAVLAVVFAIRRTKKAS